MSDFDYSDVDFEAKIRDCSEISPELTENNSILIKDTKILTWRYAATQFRHMVNCMRNRACIFTKVKIHTINHKKCSIASHLYFIILFYVMQSKNQFNYLCKLHTEKSCERKRRTMNATGFLRTQTGSTERISIPANARPIFDHSPTVYRFHGRTS